LEALPQLSPYVVSAVQVVWCGAQRCEERDGSGSLSNGKQFFPLGQVNFASGTPTNYFYTQDHLGSTREMTKTVSGTTTIEAQYGYDPYGIATKLQGSQEADFQYAGYYMHAPSGLNLPVFRAYSSSLGRFINRDPIGEKGGVNLYGYVYNNPVRGTDPLGLQAVIQAVPVVVVVVAGAIIIGTTVYSQQQHPWGTEWAPDPPEVGDNWFVRAGKSACRAFALWRFNKRNDALINKYSKEDAAFPSCPPTSPEERARKFAESEEKLQEDMSYCQKIGQ